MAKEACWSGSSGSARWAAEAQSAKGRLKLVVHDLPGNRRASHQRRRRVGETREPAASMRCADHVAAGAGGCRNRGGGRGLLSPASAEAPVRPLDQFAGIVKKPTAVLGERCAHARRAGARRPEGRASGKLAIWVGGARAASTGQGRARPMGDKARISGRWLRDPREARAKHVEIRRPCGSREPLRSASRPA